MTGTMVSRRDDSDFLQDQNYGTTLLLPNRNLDPAYQRLDMFTAASGSPAASAPTPAWRTC